VEKYQDGKGKKMLSTGLVSGVRGSVRACQTCQMPQTAEKYKKFELFI
jgi:hypothetical protein